MAFTLFTVPKLALRLGRDAVDLAWHSGEAVLRHATGHGGAADSPATPAAAPDRSDAVAEVAVRPVPSTPPAAATAPSPQPIVPQQEREPEPEPDELVGEFADPGAEEGAGAELHVAEPWNGYDGMTAPAIADRLVVADAATLAAVQLYEATHRGRRTVITAAEQQMARTR